jgi:hypothetical protein
MAKPKLALIPAAQGSKFYSVLPSDGVGDFDFARASAATRINKYGLIETVASGQSRLNYPLIDGVVNGCPSHILEPQRTNLITQSESFDNAYWSKTSSSVVSGYLSPKGDLSAFKLIPNNASTISASGLQENEVVIATSYSFTFFAKKGEYNKIKLNARDNVSGANATDAEFNLATGIVTNGVSTGTVTNLSANIIGLPNGWYRCSLNFSVSLATTMRMRIYTGDSISTIGDGTSGLYIWGAQLEAGSYPTSYIVSNSGSATTRVAETANNSGDASTFNDSEGVLYFEASAQDNSITTSVLSISNGSNVNSLYTGFSSSSNTIQAQLVVGGVAQTNMNYVVSDRTEFNKVAILYQNNNHKMYVNGVEAVVDTSGSVPSANTFDRLNFDLGQGSFDFYGNIKQVQYYDSALTDSELETLTSWTSFSEMATSQLYSIQ